MREQVAGAIDLVVHQARLPDGTRRIVAVAEVVEGGGLRSVFALRDGRERWRCA